MGQLAGETEVGPKGAGTDSQVVTGVHHERSLDGFRGSRGAEGRLQRVKHEQSMATAKQSLGISWE